MGSSSPENLPPGSRSVIDGSGWKNAPEILPAEARNPPPDPPRRRKPIWLAAPATHLLVGINCAVWLAMIARGVSPFSPTVEQLMHWGADNAGSVLIGGQWWLIVTAMFLHVGILHLATNMWCLWNLGLLAEPLMGSWGVLAVYILTGAAGNLLSTFANWWLFYPDWMKYHDPGVFPAGAGASGAVFGIAGALIVLLGSKRLPVPPLELKKLRRSVIYFAAINLFIGISISIGTAVTHSGLSVDNYAHMGGCACGLLFAWPMVPRLGAPRPTFNLRLRIAVGMVVGLLVLFGFFLVQLPPQN
jgi:rhomboid protease GluP